MTGCQPGTKITRTPSGQKGPIAMSAVTNGFQATDTLTTTVDGRTYRQPANGT